MSGQDLGQLFTQGLVDGLLQGAIILLPYIIGFCVLCVIIGAVKRFFRKHKK